MKEPISLSVIIPTRNAGAHIKLLLDKLKEQSRTPDEIIVIDSHSEDDTATLAAEQGARLIVIEKNCFDHGATRNRAAAEAGGDILVFMTQDALPADTSTLEALLKPLEEKDVAVSFARQVAHSGANISERYLRLANYPPLSRIKSRADLPEMGILTFQSSNVCAAYRRDLFEALGCFPQPIVCNEDMIFAARAVMAGYRIAYTAEAVVLHTHDYNFMQQFRRYFDIAASLDYEPLIGEVGRTERKGIGFLKGQLVFLRREKQLGRLPRVLLDTGGKYLGYKLGKRHRSIPAAWKKYLGMNSLYWTRVAANKLEKW